MFNNGINPEQAGGILMAQVLAKSSRGKFINVRRTIRDLEDIEDFSSRGGDRTSASDLLKMLQGKVEPKAAPDTTFAQERMEMNLTSEILAKVVDKLDTIATKLGA